MGFAHAGQAKEHYNYHRFQEAHGDKLVDLALFKGVKMENNLEQYKGTTG